MYYQAKAGDVSIIQRIPPVNQSQTGYGIVSLRDNDDMIIEQVINFYCQALSASEKARRFLLSRGIAGDQTLSAFRLGYSDRSLGLYLQCLGKSKEAFTRGALQRIGFLKPSGHEFFRGCVIFPFVNVDGKVTGAYGKRITEKLKAGSVYQVHWITERTRFFNEMALSAYSEIIMCKNPLEVLVWWQHGFKNVMALMGCLSFSDSHLEALKARHLNRLYLALGTSSVELRAAWEINSVLAKSGIELRMIMFPDGMDTDAFVRSTESPIQALAELLAHSLAINSVQS